MIWKKETKKGAVLEDSAFFSLKLKGTTHDGRNLRATTSLNNTSEHVEEYAEEGNDYFQESNSKHILIGFAMSQAANSQGRDDSAVMGQTVHTAGSHGSNTMDDFSRNADGQGVCGGAERSEGKIRRFGM